MCAGQHRRELLAQTGEDVHHAARNVTPSPSASASSTAASGCGSEATTTTAFPPTSAGATRETSPSQRRLSAAQGSRPRPVGSGTVKLKYGPATGFD